ncbi:MAG: TRAP transporter small permease subunit [Rhizobiaceae bacterium]
MTDKVEHPKLTLYARMFGWANLGIVAAFVINVFLTNAGGMPGAALLSNATGASAWIQAALYPAVMAIAVLFVLRAPDMTLRAEADRITELNNFIIRAAFWSVFIIGVVDAAVTFLRVEGMLTIFIGEDLNRELGRSQFRGTYIHIPLIIVSIGLAAVTRTLGFIWLSLLIVIAELLIVFSRFVFSYEQAFIADLVRFWYAALFLFASAYTLVEEGHVRVDVFYASFKDKTKGFVNAIGTLTMGIVFCWTILIVGMSGKNSIINSPVFNFEVTQSSFGMYVKYMMAAFLGIFAISMMVQFTSYLLCAIADWRGDPGHVDHESVSIA